MKKTALVTFIICLIGLSFAFRENPPKYENLKVLPKNTTKQQMDSIMKHFSMSLGVKCTFCHVRNEEQKNFNFASDDKKHKLVARNMFKMMNKINKKYFKQDNDDNNNSSINNGNRITQISCYSCHHGKENPETKPPAQPASGGAASSIPGPAPASDKKP